MSGAVGQSICGVGDTASEFPWCQDPYSGRGPESQTRGWALHLCVATVGVHVRLHTAPGIGGSVAEVRLEWVGGGGKRQSKLLSIQK